MNYRNFGYLDICYIVYISNANDDTHCARGLGAVLI